MWISTFILVDDTNFWGSTRVWTDNRTTFSSWRAVWAVGVNSFVRICPNAKIISHHWAVKIFLGEITIKWEMKINPDKSPLFCRLLLTARKQTNSIGQRRGEMEFSSVTVLRFDFLRFAHPRDRNSIITFLVSSKNIFISFFFNLATILFLDSNECFVFVVLVKKAALQTENRERKKSFYRRIRKIHFYFPVTFSHLETVLFYSNGKSPSCCEVDLCSFREVLTGTYSLQYDTFLVTTVEMWIYVSSEWNNWQRRLQVGATITIIIDDILLHVRDSAVDRFYVDGDCVWFGEDLNYGEKRNKIKFNAGYVLA